MQCAASVHGAATLSEVFDATLARVPHAPALDDGLRVLSYRDLDVRVRALATRLTAAGLSRGDRIGIKLPSGHAHLYIAILAVLRLGAAYVPVDDDDPPARAELVFGDSEVTAILTGGRILPGPSHPAHSRSAATTTGTAAGSGPGPDDDAWVIFTSGSTGRPKGVAITHRAAAAFVDGEAARFADPDTGRAALGPGDRVLAGLSVAFDASCEEMWLAWRHGACLVPAPRDLVRAGVELGDWLPTRRITAVSTVPTLAGLWTRDQLATVRLLILGGEACPAPLATRLASFCERVWNTYGPTEATVVATAARLRPDGSVRIGRPLPGYQTAVVDPDGQPVQAGALGELVIAGAGLGRYLDPVRDAAGFRALPALGWDRAYYSGDLVRADPRGLTYHGRLDDQIKIRGFRVEPAEVEAALHTQPGVASAAVVVTTTPNGDAELVGYFTTEPTDADPIVDDQPVDDQPVDDGTGADRDRSGRRPTPPLAVALRKRMATALPAHLVPARLHQLAAMPTLTSGKVDRSALRPPPDAAAQLDDLPHESHPAVASHADSEDGDEPDEGEVKAGGGEEDGAEEVERTGEGQRPRPGEPAAAGHRDGVRELAGSLAVVLGRVLGRVSIPLEAHLFDEVGADSLSLAHFCRATREDPALPAIDMRQIYRHPTLLRLASGLARAARPASMPPAGSHTPQGAGVEPRLPASGEPKPEAAAAVPIDPRLPGRLRYALCGVAQALVLAGVLGAGGALAALAAVWLAGAHGPLELFARAVTATAAGVTAMTAVPIVAKWLLVGRWRPCTIPLWSPAHLRLWTVATLIRLAPPVAMIGSPLYNAYLRALGARIGPGAVIFSRTVPVCTDLLTVGSGAVIGKRASFTGYRPGRDPHTGTAVLWTGTLAVGDAAHLDIDTSIGDHAHLAHASALHHDQHIPSRQHWHGSPAEPARHRPVPAPAAEVTAGRRARYALTQLAAVFFGMPLLITAAALALGRYPALVTVIDPVRQSGSGFVAHAAQTSLQILTASVVLGLAVVVLVPRALAVFVVPERVYPLYGLAYAAHRALAAISNAPWFLRLYGDSAYIVGYLRAIGYRAARDGQTGTNFGAALHHETPFLVTVGPGTQVSDDVGFATAEYSSTAFWTRPVTLGGRGFLGNALHLPPGTTLGEGCFVGTKTHIPAGATVPDGTGMLGSPPFRIPAARPQDPALVLEPAELAAALQAKTRHNLATIAWFLLTGWARLYLAVLLGPAVLRTLDHLLGAPAAAAAAAVTVAIGELALGIVVERAALGFRRLAPRRCSIYQRHFWAHERFWKLSGNYRLFAGTPLKPVISRLLGAVVGRGVFDDGAGLTETGLVSLGDGVILGAGSVLQAHSMEDGEFKSDRIELARHVVLAPGAFVHYGTHLAAAAELDPDSFLMKGEAIAAHAVWTGNPARPTVPGSNR